MTKVESPEHLARRRARLQSPEPALIKRWTFNQHLTDEEVALHFAGLKIVSRPGALYGPEDDLRPGRAITVRFPPEPAYGPLSARTVPAKIERVRDHPTFPYAVVIQEAGAELRAVVHASWVL